MTKAKVPIVVTGLKTTLSYELVGSDYDVEVWDGDATAKTRVPADIWNNRATRQTVIDNLVQDLNDKHVRVRCGYCWDKACLDQMFLPPSQRTSKLEVFSVATTNVVEEQRFNFQLLREHTRDYHDRNVMSIENYDSRTMECVGRRVEAMV